MSFQAMAWAVSIRLPTREKFVLLMLANYASNDAGDCFPSLARLCDDTGMSKPTVISAIGELEILGALTVKRQKLGTVNLPNVYRLALDWSLPVDAEGGSKAALPESVIEPITTTTTISAPREKVDFDFASGCFVGPIDDHFGRWRLAFPAIVVDAEVLRAAAWLAANPKNRKTNYLSFLTNWLSRAQDRAPRSGNSGDFYAKPYSPTPPRPTNNHDRRAEFAARVAARARD